MKLLLVLCLVACAYSAALEECSQGQAYWCTSLKTAKGCGAVQHCIDNVWSQQAPYKGDVGDVCNFCKNIIGDVRGLFNKTYEAKVEKYLDSACDLIPVPELSDKCKDYVNNDLSELYDMIRSKLNPGAVCSAMCLCSAYKDFTHETNTLHRVALVKASQDIGVRLADVAPVTTKAPPKTTTPKPDICKDCLKLVNDIKTAFTDKATESQVTNYLKQNVCAMLGPLSDECNQSVDTYIPELMELIDDGVNANLVCKLIAFCPGGDRSLLPRMRLAKSPLFKAASKLEGTKECDACKVFLSEMQDLDRNKVLQADLEQILKEKLCPLLGSLKQECLDTVNLYGQFMFEFLANELDPNTRCESLGFCSSNNLVHAAPHQMSPTRKATPSVSNLSSKKLKQSPQCVICEFIMNKLESILMNNRSEAEVIAALDKVCSILPDTIKEECDSFIKTYGPAILDLLLQEISPQVVCTTLGLCLPEKETLLHKMPKVVKTTEKCGICETIIQYLDSLLEENSTVSDIEAALDKVCAVLPDVLKKQCTDFVAQYGPQIIQLIAQLDDPKQVCTELGLCQKNRINTAMLLKPALAPLLGEKRCTYGPSYWCMSVENAKECNAVAHCEKHGWAKPRN